MPILSKLSNFFLSIFFLLVAITSLTAQESTPTSTAASVAQGEENKVSSSEVTPAVPSVGSSNAAVTTDASSSLKQNTSSTMDPSSESASSVSSEPSPDTSSSIIPTDPSMIPPPQETSPSTENDTKSPSLNDTEQKATPPEPLSTESIEKKRQELKVRYYEVRTQVEKEADVSALKEKADHATTDEEKRQALRAYYDLLFTKMKKIDASISERCDLLKKAYLRRLEQVSIQPTIPLAPSPTGEKSLPASHPTKVQSPSLKQS